MRDARDDVDPGTEPSRGASEGMPRWVKVSLVVVALLVAIFAIAKLTGAGGEHGPGRHGSGGTPSVIPMAAGWSLDARL